MNLHSGLNVWRLDQCNFVADLEPKVPFKYKIGSIVFIVLNSVSDNYIAAC